VSNNLRILLVEDLADDAELELRELRRSGLVFDSKIVETEADFRRELAGFDPHIVLSDFSLPRFSGMEALGIVRKLRPDLPFIFVSGSIREENALEAMRSGATAYVLKADLRGFTSAIRRAILDAGNKRTTGDVE
jgi:DNA-binding NtrC family response regulator